MMGRWILAVALATTGYLHAEETHMKTTRLIEEMRPREIERVVKGSGIVFVPVSPRYEWHSYHLPTGVDGILAEEISKHLAERCDGLYFRCLPLALDEIRSVETKTQWGLDTNATVYGMNFPAVPLGSEYCEPAAMTAVLAGRLTALKRSRFRYVFLVNQHGGTGQQPTLERVATEWTSEGFAVRLVKGPRPAKVLAGIEPSRARYLRVGGHAGVAETIKVLAFRPDLVDLNELPEGELKVAEVGILHDKPVIPSEFNPRTVSKQTLFELTAQWREAFLDSMAAEVRDAIAH
jgi:creatinine amidohydrolase/Fe(II)-dependent formamide hydrolase-like protein